MRLLATAGKDETTAPAASSATLEDEAPPRTRDEAGEDMGELGVKQEKGTRAVRSAERSLFRWRVRRGKAAPKSAPERGVERGRRCRLLARGGAASGDGRM